MSLIKKIAIGTVQFGLDYGISNDNGVTTADEITKILKISEKYGVNTIDTAAAYGNSEKLLGNHDLQNFKIITKFINDKSYKSFKNQIKNSFIRLGVEKIYSIMAHRPLSYIKNYELYNHLLLLKNQGKISKIGASFNTIDEIDMILDSRVYLDIIQVPYNILDNRFENHMKRLKKIGIEIHTRSAFLQGLFFCDVKKLNPFFNPLKEYISYLQGYSEKLPSILLSNILEKKFIDKVVIGVNNSNQLEKNLKSLKKNPARLRKFKHKIKSELITPSMWPKN